MHRQFVRLLASMVLVVALSSIGSAAFAQADGSITYGELVQVNITDASKGVRYTFEGQAGEVAVIQAIPAQDNGALSAEVRVLDDRDRELASSEAIFIFGRSGQFLAVELPSDGTYTIFLHDDTGIVDLSVISAPILQIGEPIEGEVETTPENLRLRYDAVFAIDSTADFNVRYLLTSGNYQANLIVYELVDGGNLVPAAYVGGERFLGGSLTIAGSRDFYIAAIGPLNFTGYNDLDPALATFTIELEQTS